MSTDLNINMVTEFIEQNLQNKPVDKFLGETTIVTYGILEDQVAVAASAVKTSHNTLITVIIITSKLWALIALFGVVSCCWWLITNGHLLWLTVICHLWGCICPSSAARLSFVRGSLCSLHPDTLGVLFPPLGGLPPTGDSSVCCPWFATPGVSK